MSADLIRHTVRDWSFRDTLNGEIVYEQCRVPGIKFHLHALCGYCPQWALEHEYGEVLNNKVFYNVR